MWVGASSQACEWDVRSHAGVLRSHLSLWERMGLTLAAPFLRPVCVLAVNACIDCAPVWPCISVPE